MQQNLILMKQHALIHQNLLKKTDLSSLKSDICKLSICELQTTPPDFSGLSNTLKSDAIKKAES